ncbi:MAG: T9SS type A sorting domain-containing protein [Bacteroidota bacterium]|nr:T9SS type A sorting domain-containing protein [Bacteroidota bacterium]
MNKHIIAAICLTVFSVAGVFSAKAGTQLTITGQNGSVRSIELSALGKITFQSSELMFHFQDGVLEPMPISSVKRMTFTQQSSLPKADKTVTISIYPNPATDYLIINNLPAKASQVFIYSISGRLMLSRTLESTTEQLTVSQLPDGFYILKINDQAFKFSKE